MKAIGQQFQICVSLISIAPLLLPMVVYCRRCHFIVYIHEKKSVEMHQQQCNQQACQGCCNQIN